MRVPCALKNRPADRPIPIRGRCRRSPRQRAPQLGNPLFGYSTHPMPPPVLGDETPRGSRSKTSSAAMAKLQELQQMLQEERTLRKRLEAELAVAKR